MRTICCRFESFKKMIGVKKDKEILQEKLKLMDEQMSDLSEEMKLSEEREEKRVREIADKLAQVQLVVERKNNTVMGTAWVLHKSCTPGVMISLNNAVMWRPSKSSTVFFAFVVGQNR